MTPRAGFGDPIDLVTQRTSLVDLNLSISRAGNNLFSYFQLFFTTLRVYAGDAINQQSSAGKECIQKRTLQSPHNAGDPTDPNTLVGFISKSAAFVLRCVRIPKRDYSATFWFHSGSKNRIIIKTRSTSLALLREFAVSKFWTLFGHSTLHCIPH